MPQEMLAPKQLEPKKKPQAKIVENEDMTHWPTLEDWQVVRARDSMKRSRYITPHMLNM